MTATITKTLRVELKGCPEYDTHAFYDRLFDLRSVMHRLLNAGIVGALVDARANVKPRPLDHIYAELAATRAYAAERRTKSARTLERCAAKVATAQRALSKATDEKREAAAKHVAAADAAHKAALHDDARWQRQADLAIPSVISDALQRRCHDALRRFYKGAGSERLPSFKFGAPIFLRDGAWNVRQNGDGYALEVKITTVNRERVRVRIAATSGSHWALLKRMCAEENVKLGDCKIVYDLRRAKWFALLSHTVPRPVAETLSSENVMVAHRGRHNFLTCISSPGRYAVIAKGDDILEMKRRVGARRKQLQAQIRNIGKGARGRGKRRRFQTYERLGDYESRFVRTKCQQVAAAIVARAVADGCGTLAIERYGTVKEDLRYVPSWPWFQLKESIGWACKKAGVTVVEVDAAYSSTTCPRCLACDPKFHASTGAFHCGDCGFARDADWVAALHMLERAGAPMNVWLARLRAESRLAESLKGDEHG